MMQNQNVIAVFGATGYVGGRFVPSLLEKGWKCRAVGRSLDKLKSRPWANHPNIELVKADVSDASSLETALKGVRAAYYLIHSMNPSEKDYKEADRKAASNFRQAAERNAVQQIIYLAGLGDDEDALSDHLKSRREVESILKSGSVPVTIFRAAMIIGSGSASFEILRYLVDRLPVMITPKWVNTPSQPIAIRNVLTYLIECLNHEATLGRTFDIGGPDILTYDELMRIYAVKAGLPRRLIIPVPVLTPRLSSYWIHLVTPVPASIAKPLAEGLKNPVICRNKDILTIIPQQLLSAEEAMERALKRTGDGDVDTSWTDAGRMPPVELSADGDPEWAGGTVYRDIRRMIITQNPDEVWQRIESIGGKNGWYHADFLWALRGFIDRIIGGVGLRRGRRDPHKLGVGDSLDFWRVLKVVPNKCLLLAAEMKLPGKATLEFRISEKENRTYELTQTATFKPKGLFGIIYWFSILPLHEYVFGGMIKKIISGSLN